MTTTRSHIARIQYPCGLQGVSFFDSSAETGIFAYTKRARKAQQRFPSPHHSEPISEAPMTEYEVTTVSDTVKLCECGCGNPAPIAKKNDPRLGWIKGQPLRFVRGHAGTKSRTPFIGPLEPGTRMIPLTKGLYAKVDESDYEWLSQVNWCVHTHGYALCNGGRGKAKMRMHRLIAGTPEGMLTDHINNDPLDNRRANLRTCTYRQNNWNAKAYKGGTSSPYKGVSWNKSGRHWVAYVSASGRMYHLGSFDNPEEAARARDAKAIELHGPYAWVNFPEARL